MIRDYEMKIKINDDDDGSDNEEEEKLIITEENIRNNPICDFREVALQDRLRFGDFGLACFFFPFFFFIRKL